MMNAGRQVAKLVEEIIWRLLIMKISFRFLFIVILLSPIFAFAESSYDPWIQTDKDVYAIGEEIRVQFGNAPGFSGDWIGIAPQGSPDTYVGDYKYMPEGLIEGLMIFKSPLQGNYEVRAYYNYSSTGYMVTARYPFKVVIQEEYGDIDGGYYEVPITYGEPCYYLPPIIVTFPFDYFTYELSGSYVDIVFWRNGHPRHRKPWHDHGQWVTADDIHSGHWHHKISGDDLLRHRDKLKEHNNIVHPDSYYGIKPGHQIKTGQSSQLTGKKPQAGNKQILKMFQPRQWERKSSQQIPNNQVTVKPSSQTEHKIGSHREASKDKEKQSEESSSQTEHKTDSSREQSRESDNRGWGGSSSQQSDNHSQSGWGGQSDNHGWGGNSGGGSSGHQSSWGQHNDKKGHW